MRPAGGVVMRDLFQHDDGGWLQDPALLDRLVAEKLKAEAETIAAEGWKWIEVAPDFPYGHTAGLRRLIGTTDRPHRRRSGRAIDALKAEYDELEEQYSEADELPDEIDQRLGEIEAALAAFDNRPVDYDPAEIARAGAFVSIDGEGALSHRARLRPSGGRSTWGRSARRRWRPRRRTTGSDSVVQRGGHHHRRRADGPKPNAEEDDAISRCRIGS